MYETGIDSIRSRNKDDLVKEIKQNKKNENRNKMNQVRNEKAGESYVNG